MTLGTIWAPRLLSVLRIVDGLVLLQYGTAKLFGWPDVEMFEDLKWFSLFGIAGMFELVGGTLLILGLFTRPAAVPLLERSRDALLAMEAIELPPSGMAVVTVSADGPPAPAQTASPVARCEGDTAMRSAWRAELVTASL